MAKETNTRVIILLDNHFVIELLEDIPLRQSKRELVQKTENSNLDLQPNNALAVDQYIPTEQEYTTHNKFLQITNYTYVPASYGWIVDRLH